MKIANRNDGFTLIEALAAIAILSFVAVAAYSGLDSLCATLKKSEEENAKWRDVAMFFDHVEKAGIASAPFQARPGRSVAEGGNNDGISFIRLGSQYRANGQLSTSRAVGYRLREDTVEMSIRPLTAGPDEREARAFPVIHGAQSLSARYLGADGWLETWDKPGRPRAMEIRLALSSGEEIRRIIRVR
ncbi:MAG: prepilin-type N-terminal cleavage/methylation domain-containing protein [Nitrospinae bacterium]|nr:prepilin-type N-terminal cleavage/methylation domain-containing protein [Nitrospinota bacterium]